MKAFIAELRRRHVFRVAGIYIVAGWVLAQVAGTLEEALSLPEWFDAVAVSLLLLGFPIALLLAWAFDLTPDGPQRTGPADGDRPAPSRIPDYLALIAVIAVSGAFIWQQWQPEDEAAGPVAGPAAADVPTAAGQAAAPETEAAAPIDPATIAVLPFDDLSPTGDQTYFTDGLSEELLNVLVRVDGLRVASRTSSFQFKGRDVGIPAIAAELRVRHIVEGSVRKAGDNIRVTAQLIDAATDQHLWSETFDKTLTVENLFAIQDEIAGAIVAELDERLTAALSGGMIERGFGIETVDLDAYDSYLRARELFRERSFDNIPETIRLLQASIERDPAFARAWATLSAVYYVAPSWGITDRDYSRLAAEAADRATELDDALPLPYSVRGSIALKAFDYETAAAQLQRGVELGPKRPESHYFMGRLQQTLAFHERAIERFSRCLELDPGYEICRRYIALEYLALGRFEEATALYETGLRNGQTSWDNQFVMAYAKSGNTAAALLLLLHLYEDEFAVADAMLRRMTEPGFGPDDLLASLRRWYDAEPRNYEFEEGLTGLFAIAAGRYDRLHPRFEGEFSAVYMFNRAFEDYLASPERKRIIVEMKLPEYWRKHGFPPRCRPVGSDDFECD